MRHLSVELSDQTFQSIDTIKNFDALRMRIVSDFEWSAHSSHLEKKANLIVIYTNIIRLRI